MSFCRNCGASVPEGNKFCANCGTPVDAPETQTRDTNQNNANPNDTIPNYRTTTTYDYRVNIKKREIALAVILSIVTCGIYGIIWYVWIINDLNVAAQTPEDKSAGIVILLSIVTCGIYGLIWMYQAGEKIDKIKGFKGEAPSNSAVLYLVLALVGFSIISFCLIQSELNKVAIDA